MRARWGTTAWRGITIVGALLALLVVAATAQASGVPVAPQQPNAASMPAYQGWGVVREGTAQACSMDFGVGCTYGGPLTYAAWRWGARGWTSAPRVHGSSVYIYPYTGGWRWTWSRDAGWSAMRAEDLVIPVWALAAGGAG
jgi:hypothetical protein